MDEEALKKFNDMFDLVSPEEDDEQGEEYAHATDSEESFEELAKEISEEIKDLEDVPVVKENPHDIVKEVSAKKESDYEEETILKEQDFFEDSNDEECSDNPDDTDDFDAIDVVVKVEEKEKEVEEKEKEVEEKEKEVEEKKKEVEEVVANDFEIKCDNSIEWSLKSPSEMYNSFYRQKKFFLERCLYGGQIEFSRWTKELEDAEVDVVTEVFDQQIIIKQMEEVQHHRNRVKYIGVRVNNQYYLFKRYIVLLRGYLARIQYLKPVLKQDGLIMEHMGDIELYFGRLESLHSSVSETEDNLAASYEMLSRKVTICMELPPVERYERPSSSKSYISRFSQISSEEVEKEVSDELDGFDALPTGAKAGKKEQKSGTCGWGDL